MSPRPRARTWKVTLLYSRGESRSALMFPFPEEKMLSLREYPGAESYGPYVAVGGATGKDGGFSR